MHSFGTRILLVLALGVAALAAVPNALAAQSWLDAACETGQIANETSQTGDVAYTGNGIDTWSRTSELALRARATVDAKDSVSNRYCNVLTTFKNTLTVKPGTTGLAAGTPVTLAMTVAVQGDVNAGYNGPGAPEQQPASFLADASFNTNFEVKRGQESVGHFAALARRKEWASSPGPYYPNGIVIGESMWHWELRGNRGDALGDEHSSYSQICPAWPIQFPCLISEPGPPPPPDHRGTRTILVDALVGDQLQLNGQLTILAQGARARASSNFPALAGAGMRASFGPGPGFEGLTLSLEVGQPQAGPTVTIGDATVIEGDSGKKQLSFPVRLSPVSDETVGVSYRTADGTATSPYDYVSQAGGLVFTPGVHEKTIVIDVPGDTAPEADETFQVLLVSATNARIGDSSGQGTIVDNDGTVALPTLTIDDATLVEGTGGTTMAAVDVHLSAPGKANVLFDYSTTDGTAVEPGDYLFASGTTTIPIGETGATILVPVVGDGEIEGAETFDVLFSNLRGAELSGDARATVTITDDDGCIPVLSYDFVEAKGCFEADGDGFKADGPVQVNGLDLVPNPGAEIVIDPAHRHAFSRGGFVSVRAGDFEAWKGTFDWKTPLPGPSGKAHVAFFAVSPLDNRSLKGLKLANSITLEFNREREALMTVPLGIPLIPIKFGETTLAGAAVLVTDNERGLHSDSLRVTAAMLPVPPVMVKQLVISWDQLKLRWEGDATVVLPTPTALELSAGFAFQNGAFAGAHGGVDNLDLPIGNGIYVQAIRFGVEFDPLKVNGGIGLSAGPLVAGKTAVRIDGDFALTFGDPFIVEASGKLKLVDWQLATAYFRYFSTGTLEFGGSIAVGLPDPSKPAKQPVHLIAYLNGWVDGTRGFAAHGGAEVMVFGLPLVGAEALVSNIGAAACGRIAWLKAGFGYRWETGELAVMSGDACDVGAYSPPAPIASGGAVQAGASAPLAFKLPKSDEGVVLRLHGSDGTPTVKLTGPSGRTVTTPSAAGAPLVNDEFVVMQDEETSTTIVAIRRPAGTWTVTPQAGSPQVSSVEHASIGSAPQVTADVRGDMHQPRLSWKTRGAAGQVVTFIEEADDVARVIARTGDARGTIAFTPADGPAGTRKIVAIVEQGGIPRARMTVAQYQAPDPDDDAPNDSLARKRLGELKRSVVRAHLRPSLERELVGSLRAARRALRPPTPNVATACARVDDFIVQVWQAARRPATPPTQASQWLDAAASIKQLLRCT